MLYYKVFLYLFLLLTLTLLKKWFKKGEYSNWEVYVKSKRIYVMQYLNLKMQGPIILEEVNVIVAINNNIKNKYYVVTDLVILLLTKIRLNLHR